MVGVPEKITMPFDHRLALRIEDAAAAIGIGRSTVRRLIVEGRLRSHLIGGRRVVERASLEELFREKGGSG